MLLKSAFILLPLVCPRLGLVLCKFLEKKFPEPAQWYIFRLQAKQCSLGYGYNEDLTRHPQFLLCPQPWGLFLSLGPLGIPFISLRPLVPRCQRDTTAIPAFTSPFIPGTWRQCFLTCILSCREFNC